MWILADCNVTTQVSIDAVFLQKAVSTDEDLKEPLQNLCIAGSWN